MRLADISEDILRMAREFRTQTAETLAGLIKIRSYSGDEEEICRHIEKLCNQIGVDSVYIDGFGNVVAKIGNGDRILALDAHIDTVAVGDSAQWKNDPFSGGINDGLVYGRGAADQKGGAAAILSAARILKELNYGGAFSVYFTFTVLEEDCDGLCWKYLIEQENLRPEFAVSTEPTSCKLYRGHRGRMEIEAAVRGISAHGSAPERGVSAAYKTSRAALAIEKMNEDIISDDFLGKGTAVVSKIDVHGPSQCAVPDVGSIYIDRRLTWGETAETAIEQVTRYLGDDVEKVRMPQFDKRGWRGAEFGQELYFPTWKVSEDHPLVQGGADTFRALFETDPQIGKWTFSTNCVAICGRHGIPCIGFGPGDEVQAHAPNEHTRINDLVTCSAFYALLPLVLGESS